MMTADPCANTDQCRVWVRPDDRCHRNTEPHTCQHCQA